MTSDPRDHNEREQQALDALLAQALRSVDESRFPRPDDPAPILEPDDERALKALGSDLVRRIVRGGKGPSSKKPPLPPSAPRRAGRTQELAGAMHRGGEEDGDLTDIAREEIERKIREVEAAEAAEADAAEGEEDDGPPDGPP